MRTRIAAAALAALAVVCCTPAAKTRLTTALGRFFRDVARARARTRRYGNKYALAQMVLKTEAPLDLSKPQHDGTVTLSELEDGDGVDGAPVYVALRGRVYDVSAGKKFYGVGKPYHHFVGRDASRAFATGCRAAECVSADLDGLGPSQLRELDRWMEMYETHDKYTFVGTLVEDPVDVALGSM